MTRQLILSTRGSKKWLTLWELQHVPSNSYDTVCPRSGPYLLVTAETKRIRCPDSHLILFPLNSLSRFWNMMFLGIEIRWWITFFILFIFFLFFINNMTVYRTAMATLGLLNRATGSQQLNINWGRFLGPNRDKRLEIFLSLYKFMDYDEVWFSRSTFCIIVKKKFTGCSI